VWKPTKDREVSISKQRLWFENAGALQITAAVFGQINEAVGYVDAPLIQYAAR
jgi:hypothetical protein